MKVSQIDSLKRFAPYVQLYKCLGWMGAESIIKEYLGIESARALPLSLAHGVQPIGSTWLQDVLQPEPIHWSYNKAIHDSASKVKESVLLPHPWIMLKRIRCGNGSRVGTLLIGPVPSRANDEALYSIVLKGDLPDGILVKPRGVHARQSMEFWKSKGIEPIACKSYSELYDVFSGYRFVVAPYPTSAIFLAASAGCSVSLIRNYSFFAFEPSVGDPAASPEEDTEAPWVATLKLGDDPERLTNESNELLGASLEANPLRIIEAIEDSALKCQHPFFSSRELGPVRHAGYSALARLGVARPSMVSLGIRQSISRRLLKSHFRENSLQLFEYPSIEGIISGRKRRVVRAVQPGENASAGWGG